MDSMWVGLSEVLKKVRQHDEMQMNSNFHDLVGEYATNPSNGVEA